MTFLKTPPHKAPIKKRAKAIKAAKIPESAIVYNCIKWLWLHGCFVWRQNVGAFRSEKTNSYIRFGIPGCPDIIGITPITSKNPGKFLGIECKTQGGKLSEQQIRFSEKVKANGGLYFVVHSIDELESLKGEIFG